MRMVPRQPRPLQFELWDAPCACSCCFQDVERAVRVERADAPGVEQFDAIEGGPKMQGDLVEVSAVRRTPGYALVCTSCVSSMAAILSEWLVPT